MITNERQYKITRTQADKFRRALDELSKTHELKADLHPRLARAEREALESQLQDLTDELEAYDALQSSEASIIEINDFSELADGLIKARIASGLTQQDLAERVGLKPQQIQRYEAERYAGASLTRLIEIVKALGVRISNDIFVPFSPSGFDGLVKKLSQVGVDRDFLTARLMDPRDTAIVQDELTYGPEEEAASIGRTTDVLSRIYGWDRASLFSAPPLAPPAMAAAEARFKMPARREHSETSAYAAYAHYLALVVLSAVREAPAKVIPEDPVVMRRSIIDAYGSVSLDSCLRFAWDLGVPILPLNDGGTFHGACWRVASRNVVVLKQRSPHQARWLFDLLHELYHASQFPDRERFEVIELDETSAERRESDEEIMASQYAGEVALDGRADEIAQLCVSAAGGSVQRLKGVVPRIADQESVDLGALANYLAFRLSWQGINWWGAAANLQRTDQDPWMIARDIFFERFPFEQTDQIDRGLLERALEKG